MLKRRANDHHPPGLGVEVNSTLYEQQMREHEIYSRVRVMTGLWIVVRADGVAFHGRTRELEKPYDRGFARAMSRAAGETMEAIDSPLCFIQSDEASFVLRPDSTMFGRRHEKLVSVVAGVMSAAFVRFPPRPGGGNWPFDCRVWIGRDVADVVDYMSWRQADAGRNCLNGWARKCVRDEGFIAGPLMHQELLRMKNSKLHELLAKHGINFAKLPAWQRNGVYVRSDYFNEFDTGKVVRVRPRLLCKLVEMTDLPHGDDFRGMTRDYLERLMARVPTANEPSAPVL